MLKLTEINRIISTVDGCPEAHFSGFGRGFDPPGAYISVRATGWAAMMAVN